MTGQNNYFDISLGGYEVKEGTGTIFAPPKKIDLVMVSKEGYNITMESSLRQSRDHSQKPVSEHNSQ